MLVAAAVVTLAVLIFDAATPAPTPAQLPDDPYERALALLTDYPVIDGYVNLLWWDANDWGRGLGGARASSSL